MMVSALPQGSSAQPQAGLMAASTVAVAGVSSASSAALRMSDCRLPAARGTSDCLLRPNAPGSGPKVASGHPLWDPGL